MPASKTHPHTLFIAFSGKKQCGKDTAAEMAASMLTKAGKKIEFMAFAKPLKEMCINILGLDRALVYGTDEDKNEPTHIQWDGFSDEVRKKYAVAWMPANRNCLNPRRHIINEPYVSITRDPVPRVGPMSIREVLQVVGTDIFRAVYEDVWARAPFNMDWEGYDVVILTDCRFPNEKRVTEEYGGVIIRIERDTGLVDKHPSETALDDESFDIVYHNDGSLDDLQTFVKETLDKQGLL